MFKHKKKLVLVFCIIAIFCLSGCSSKVENTDKVVSLFANRLFYDTQVDEYKEMFSDSQLYNERAQEVEEDLQNNFATVFEPISGTLSKSEREDISISLIDKVRDKASYSYTIDETTKNTIKVTYHIKGFDYAHLVGMTMSNLNENADNIEIGTVGAKHIVTIAYYDALEKASSIDKPVDISIYFKRDDNKKWLVDTKKSKEKDIQNLLFVFMTGKRHDDDYEKKMIEEINQITSKEQTK
ncbi:hypothetical protein BW731_07420 [Vagococcus martis]|uniref:DUF5105 domain-containing protein n=1 Tax=Vagococcus martis TaxID=1768210 RepID=A0A1V4DHV4_9ENTE|nr:hypothetical protein [Vagococcus martis]OPF88012.1 hypothetical protein BW731_07420 [Vagococcus martis]